MGLGRLPAANNNLPQVSEVFDPSAVEKPYHECYTVYR